MATASPEYWPSSNATRIDSYSTSCSTIGLGTTTLVVWVRLRPWLRR